MRLDTSKLIKKAELPADEMDYHRHNRFFSTHLLDRPEFVYKNHLISLKDADMELLEAALAQEELEESKRALLASQDGVASQSNIKAKDPKKDAKAAPKKGAVAEADKNAPKPIEVEYVEIESEKDYILIEKSFIQGKAAPVQAAKRSAAVKSQMTAGGAAASTAGGPGAGSTASAADASQQDASAVLALKKQARLQELQ